MLPLLLPFPLASRPEVEGAASPLARRKRDCAWVERRKERERVSERERLSGRRKVWLLWPGRRGGGARAAPAPPPPPYSSHADKNPFCSCPTSPRTGPRPSRRPALSIPVAGEGRRGVRAAGGAHWKRGDARRARGPSAFLCLRHTRAPRHTHPLLLTWSLDARAGVADAGRSPPPTPPPGWAAARTGRTTDAGGAVRRGGRAGAAGSGAPPRAVRVSIRAWGSVGCACACE